MLFRSPINENDLSRLCLELDTTRFKQTSEDRNKNARYEFVTVTSFLSFGYYGLAIPLGLNIRDQKLRFGTFFLIGSSGFFVPLILTRNKNITNDFIWSYSAGASLGIAHGYAIALMIKGNDLNDRTFLGLSSSASIIESLTMASLYYHKNYTWENIYAINSGGFWSGFYGATIPTVINKNINPRFNGLSILASSGVGMIAGNWLYKNQLLSKGEISVLNNYGLLGGYFPFVFLKTIKIDNLQSYYSGVIIGSTFGLACGLYRINQTLYSSEDANLILKGTFIGGSLGATASIIFDLKENDFLWFTGLGALSGLVFGEVAVLEKKKNYKTFTSRISIKMNPFYFQSFIGKNLQSSYKPWDPRYQNSLVNLNYTF